MKKIRVAIIGQGRSGKQIHGTYYKSQNNKYFEVAYVVEFDESFRARAEKDYPGCTALSDYTELFGKKDIDLVVNASYSEMHYPITLDLLNHGFNVMVEKPFGPTRYACDNLIRAAKENNVKLAVFQQTNLAPFFVFTKELINSGRLGNIKQIDITYNGFARRWDWQTLQKKLAGSLYNTGPHPIGMALAFLDFDENIRLEFSRLDSTPLTSGDADDYAKLILSAPGKPVVDVEICSTDAYAADTLKIQGDRGTYKCTPYGYEMTYIVDGENEERPAIEPSIRSAENEPIYCSEKLIKHTESGKFEGTAFDVGTARLYENLYKTLIGEEEFYYPVEQIARIVGIIEKAHADNPLPVKF